MSKETYQIKDYVHDEAVAFAGVLHPKGKLACNEDEMYSTDRLKLESYNPKDTIPVATFFEKNSIKKIYFYVASFTGFKINWYFPDHEVFSLFAIQWCDDANTWEKIPWHCCSVISKQPQPPLHKEAANWMLKKIFTEDSFYDELQKDLKDSKLEILI